MKIGSNVTVYSSPGFQALCGRFQDTDMLDILEMGPACGRNLEFWSHFSHSIFVADLRDSLPLPSLEDEREYQKPEWHAILNLPAGRNFDVILVWDLLNYIDESALPGLIDYLHCYCKSGTILFTMIIDQPQMPEDNYVFQIMDVEHLGYKAIYSPLRPCSRLQPRVVENTMRGFRTVDSYRMRHGIIEYLFSFNE